MASTSDSSKSPIKSGTSSSSDASTSSASSKTSSAASASAVSSPKRAATTSAAVSSPVDAVVSTLNVVLPPGWDKLFLTSAIRWLRRLVIWSTGALAANLVISGLVDALLAESKDRIMDAPGVDVLGGFLRLVWEGRLQKPIAAVRNAWAPLVALLLFREHFAVGATLSCLHSLTQRSATSPMLRQHALNALFVLAYALAVRLSAM